MRFDQSHINVRNRSVMAIGVEDEARTWNHSQYLMIGVGAIP